MNELKAKWAQQEGPTKLGITAVAAVVGIIFILKILPALVAAFGIGLFLVILFVPYWFPTIIAFVRKHPSRGGILVLNFFLGWTFVGWVVALAWAFSDNTARAAQQTIIVHNTMTPGAQTLDGVPGGPQFTQAGPGSADVPPTMLQ